MLQFDDQTWQTLAFLAHVQHLSLPDPMNREKKAPVELTINKGRCPYWLQRRHHPFGRNIAAPVRLLPSPTSPAPGVEALAALIAIPRVICLVALAAALDEELEGGHA